jgi:hypothetical protein
MFISHKKLLQWDPYSRNPYRQKSVLKSYITMWFEPVFAVLVYAYLTVYNPNVILIAIPFLAFWMAARNRTFA